MRPGGAGVAGAYGDLAAYACRLGFSVDESDQLPGEIKGDSSYMLTAPASGPPSAVHQDRSHTRSHTRSSTAAT